MPDDIHTVLNECKAKAKTLVAEIEKFKAATEVNLAAAASLERTAEALEQVISKISPFTTVQFVFFQRAMIAWGIVNTIVLLVVLFSR